MAGTRQVRRSASPYVRKPARRQLGKHGFAAIRPWWLTVALRAGGALRWTGMPHGTRRVARRFEAAWIARASRASPSVADLAPIEN